MTTDPLALLAEVDRATDRLLETVRNLTDADVAAPSLLPGWTRGHVLTHLARNADGLSNLVHWAATGEETPMYGPGSARDDDIEAGSGRPVAAQLADLETTATKLAERSADMPAEGWTRTVTWRGGSQRLAATIPWARLLEVEVHHVDLAAGYGPGDWPTAFSHRMLHDIIAKMADRAPSPITLHAVDLGHDLQLSRGTDAPVVTGHSHALAAWLSGRSAGTGLTVRPAGALPTIPDWM